MRKVRIFIIIFSLPLLVFSQEEEILYSTDDKRGVEELFIKIQDKFQELKKINQILWEKIEEQNKEIETLKRGVMPSSVELQKEIDRLREEIKAKDGEIEYLKKKTRKKEVSKPSKKSEEVKELEIKTPPARVRRRAQR
ncbi:MAG: hypothetical protein NC817_02160 [Candidatus Omnitrophica bacterium]|nr:hypothetical protein [Candidatus Omnitrophota bacterium]